MGATIRGATARWHAAPPPGQAGPERFGWPAGGDGGGGRMYAETSGGGGGGDVDPPPAVPPLAVAGARCGVAQAGVRASNFGLKI